MDILTAMRKWAETVTPNTVTDHEVISAVRRSYPGGISGFIRSRVPSIYVPALGRYNHTPLTAGVDYDTRLLTLTKVERAAAVAAVLDGE